MPAARRRPAASRLAALAAVAALVVGTAACDGDDGVATPSGASATTTAGAPTTATSAGTTAAASTAAPAAGPQGCVFDDAGAPELAAVTGRDAPLDIPLAAPVTVTPDDAEAAVRAAVAGGCGFVIAYGGRLEPAVTAVAATAPSVGFVLVDAGARPTPPAPAAPPTTPAASPATGPTDDPLASTNIRVIDVRLDQAAFLAGFLSASASASHAIAVAAAADVPPAQRALADSFRAGARYRDGLAGAATTVLDAPGPPADVVLALDGRSVEDLAAGGARVVTTDGDACARTPSRCPLVLTGLVADVGPALQEVAELAAAGRFRGGTRAVTVDGAAVRLAPVPPSAGVPQGELLEVVAVSNGIARGEVRVSPRDVPA
jgi:basic membrane lipoprotein Med (substrate-binding protein (PBP1-ABC) superfamily)